MSEQFLENLMELKAQMLHFLSNELLSQELEKAYEQFTLGEVAEETQLDRGFNDWIIHDYIFEGQYHLIDLYKSNHEIDEKLAKAFAESRISYYTLVKTGNNLILKDLFDHSDYLLGNEVLLDETAVHFTRLYPFSGKYYFLDELTTFDQSHRESLIRGIMTRFSEAKNTIGYLEIGEFIKKNSFLLYIYSNIVDDLYVASDESESFDMYSSVYVISNRDDFERLMKSDFHIRALAKEHGIYQLYDGLGLLGEIVDLKDKVEFEFISLESLETGKKLIEEVFAETLVHVEDLVVKLDDLL